MQRTLTFLSTEVFKQQIGCLMLKKQPKGHDKSIIYWSSVLTEAEHTYDTTHGVCIALDWDALPLYPLPEGTCVT